MHQNASYLDQGGALPNWPKQHPVGLLHQLEFVIYVKSQSFP